jgi:hypothetical protein
MLECLPGIFKSLELIPGTAKKVWGGGQERERERERKISLE